MNGLSINIPVYNTDIRQLVKDLHEQATHLGIPCEIVIADDYSNAETKEVNKELADLSLVTYHEMEENIGRAKIRNCLCAYAQYDTLLFLDCDVRMVDDQFLKRYVECANEHDVIFGGYCYKEEQKNDNNLLRWTYDTRLRTHDAATRSKSPYTSFSTVNFIIRKPILAAHPFNEKLSKYGHEDSQLRSELEVEGIMIHHIDNPVYHWHLDENKSFLEKTRKGVENMLIVAELPECERLSNSMVLLKHYNRLKRWHLTKLVSAVFRLTKGIVEKNLCSKSPILALYQWYKLGYLCTL